MALITKPDMKFIWASGGAVVKPSDVKIQTGWTPEVPPHQWENWIQKRQDEYLAHINQRGIPEWDGNTEYEASGLSYVQGSDGVVYKSVAASGPSTTVQDPTTDVADTYWEVAFASPGSFLNESQANNLYLRQDQNGADIDDAATFRTNIGVYSKSEIDASLLQMAAPVYVTATDTVIHPVGYTHVLVELVGGGGGGGGVVGNSTHTGGGGGGGAGAFAEKIFTAAEVGASTLCTIGAGGAGGVGSGSGGAGGTTTFGAIAQAGGGSGGNGTTLSATFNVADGGAGSAISDPTGREYPSRGGAGGNGWTFGGTSVNRGIAGDGGFSLFGSGGAGKALTGTDVYAGVSGTSPGSGGSGAGVGATSGVTRNGGAGAAGLIRLTYYK